MSAPGARRWLTAAGALGVLLLAFAVDVPLQRALERGQTQATWSFLELVAELRGILFAALAGVMVLAAGAWLGRPRLRRAGTVMLLALALSGAAVAVLKPLAARPGPYGLQSRQEEAPWLARRWGRFPSGHTAATFSAAAGLAAVYPLTAPVGYALGVVVAWERTARGVHYPSDCVAGALLGWLAARLVAGRLRRRDAQRGNQDRAS
jgi:undecaprenyl-diphosphatase